MHDFLKECFPICEVASKSGISGRRHFKAVLHEVHPSVEVYQHNGISWSEEYTQNNLSSVAGMSIVAEFLSEDRDAPYGHGLTDIRDNLPLFENATMVGHFERAYIDTITVDGQPKRVLIGEGTLDEMRYPKFVEWLETNMADSVVKGSVEIVGKPEHDKHIIYSGGWKEKGRVPQIYDYSGYAILGVKPADDTAIVMELNNKLEHEEDKGMDEKVMAEIKSAVAQAVTETNSKNAEYEAQISELNAQIGQLNSDLSEKDDKIAELNEKVAQYETDIQVKADALVEANNKIAEMEKEKAVAELNAALADYSEEQQKVAEEEINAFKADPASVEINSIIGKICTEMVRQSRDAGVETNALIDVFSIVEDEGSAQNDDEVDVF